MAIYTWVGIVMSGVRGLNACFHCGCTLKGDRYSVLIIIYPSYLPPFKVNNSAIIKKKRTRHAFHPILLNTNKIMIWCRWFQSWLLDLPHVHKQLIYQFTNDIYNSETTSVTSGTGTASPSGAPEFTPGFWRGSCSSNFSLNFCVMFCRSLFLLFLWTIVL